MTTKFRAVVGLGLIMSLATFGSPQIASAAFVLKDLNSTVTIDNPPTQDGVYSWKVDGVEHLAQQWFWYRIGATGGEQSIDTIGNFMSSIADTDFNPGNDVLNIKYNNAQVEIAIKYSLAGGNSGSNASDLGEQITIHNLSTSSFTINFFQYSDFDLNATPSDDLLFFQNINSVVQYDTGLVFSETAVNTPDHYEGDTFPTILSKLNDGSPTTLNDTPPTGIANQIGPGDMTWAFQWTYTIAPGDSVSFSKDKKIEGGRDFGVPEAGSIAIWSILGLAFSAVWVSKRRTVACP